jgi:(p)ppGpp synthase/HD superfamily hydrolase
MMHQYAQTNIQLLNQLRQLDYPDAALVGVHRAYGLVIQLFSGRFRASGKTFIAHLVGTASILAHLRVSADLVTAGLLHAAYSHGDFGKSGDRLSPVKRQQVKQAVGSAEPLIARYTLLTWGTEVINTLPDRLDQLSSIDRDVVLMRLANELEERLDLGLRYCGDTKYQSYASRDCQRLVECAQKLGYPTLAIELEQAFEATVQADLPQQFCNSTGFGYSALVVPQSCRPKLSVALRRVLANTIRRSKAFMSGLT